VVTSATTCAGVAVLALTIAGSLGPGLEPREGLVHDRAGDGTTVDTKAQVTHPSAWKMRSDGNREQPMLDHGVIDPWGNGLTAADAPGDRYTCGG